MKNLKVYKKCLIIVDMVNGFVREGGLHDTYIEHTIKRQQELIEEYQKEKELTIFIKDSHELNSVEHNRFGTIKHCINGTTEAELIDEFKKYEGLVNVLVFKKNCTSFREAPGFIDTIQASSNIKEFDICGCCTDICIVNGVISTMNYLDQINREVEVRVHEDATETFNSPFHNRDEYSQAAYLLMKQQGVKIVKKLGEMKYGK